MEPSMSAFVDFATLTALNAVILAAQPAVAEKPLQIVSIDVEGGAATLFVTPQGHSLLIDTGWPPGLIDTAPKGSADRIAATAAKLGLKRIDYLLISHYHVDHVGGIFA